MDEVLLTLKDQLGNFCRDQLGDPAAQITDVRHPPSGHAGYSYLFEVRSDRLEHGVAQYYLRLAPPNVRYVGTADVLRQVRILNALRDSKVPVAPVIWSGDDEIWFGRPYFVTPALEGDTLTNSLANDAEAYETNVLRRMTEEAMGAMVELHRLDWRGVVADWGPSIAPRDDVTRWDRFLERAGQPDLAHMARDLRSGLLERLPHEPRIGIFHGDFGSANLFYSDDQLVAVIDWELVNVGPVLNDLAWFMLSSDWTIKRNQRRPGADRLPDSRALASMYQEALGGNPGDINWAVAHSAYKRGIIYTYNLMLHRRGKREDPYWETVEPDIPELFQYGLRVLGSRPLLE